MCSSALPCRGGRVEWYLPPKPALFTYRILYLLKSGFVVESSEKLPWEDLPNPCKNPLAAEGARCPPHYCRKYTWAWNIVFYWRKSDACTLLLSHFLPCLPPSIRWNVGLEARKLFCQCFDSLWSHFWNGGTYILLDSQTFIATSASLVLTACFSYFAKFHLTGLFLLLPFHTR